MAEQIDYAMMQELSGTSVFADADDGNRVELRILEVVRIMESQAAILPRIPFSVFFLGPDSFMLPQGTYAMRHQSFTEPHPIFIVPITQRPDGFLYEAVFT